MKPKRLVLFVEGDGDIQAVPILVKKILTEIDPWAYLYLDNHPFCVKNIGNLTGKCATKWVNWLKSANKRSELGGVLLVLDGDQPNVLNDQTFKKEPFCATKVARRLARTSGEAGGAILFSVACVFALQEFESWLLAGAASLRGKTLPDGRAGVRADVPLPDTDTDLVPRDAKGWFNTNMANGYKVTVDQKPLTELVTLEAIRARQPKSFRRLENAIRQLCTAIQTNQHIVSPQ